MTFYKNQKQEQKEDGNHYYHNIKLSEFNHTKPAAPADYGNLVIWNVLKSFAVFLDIQTWPKENISFAAMVIT